MGGAVVIRWIPATLHWSFSVFSRLPLHESLVSGGLFYFLI